MAPVVVTDELQVVGSGSQSAAVFWQSSGPLFIVEQGARLVVEGVEIRATLTPPSEGRSGLAGVEVHLVDVSLVDRRRPDRAQGLPRPVVLQSRERDAGAVPP